MRLLALFVIILLIAIVPIKPVNASPAANASTSYLFSSNPLGSFPANSTAYNFSLSGCRNSISARTGKTASGPGMVISTTNVSCPAFFDIQPSGMYQNFTIEVSLAWNDSSNFGFTEDQIAVAVAGIAIFNVRFGPEYGYYLQEIYSSGNKDVANEPQMNQVLNFTISYSSLSGTYFSISDNATCYLLPYAYNASGPASGNITVSFGGDISSMSLYSITTVPDFNENALPRGQSGLQLICNNAGQNLFSTQFSDSITYLKAINTLVGPSQQGGIIGFNTVNMSYFNITNYPKISGITEIVSSSNGSSLSFYIENSSSSASVEINVTDLSEQSTTIRGSFNNPLGIISLEGTQMLFGISGKLGFLRGSNLSYFTIPGITGSVPVSIFPVGNKLSSLWLVGNRLYNASISISNETASIVACDYSSLNSSQVSAVGGLMSTGYTGLFLYGGNSSIALVNNGTAQLLGPAYSRNVSISGNSSVNFSLVQGSSVYVDFDGKLTPVSGINASSVCIIYLGNEALLSIGNGSLHLYYNSSLIFTSGGPPELMTKSQYILTSSAYISVKVNTTYAYRSTMEIGNESLYSDNATFFISTTAFGAGVFAAALDVYTIQGFASSSNFTVVLDTGFLYLSTDLQNGSFLPQNFVFTINFTYWTSISSISVSTPGFHATYPGMNQSIPIEFGNSTGNRTIWVNLTDAYSAIHTYAYHVTIISNSTSGFNLNLVNGTYFNSTHLVLDWSIINFARNYIVSFYSVNYTFTKTTNASNMNVTLANGEYVLKVYATLADHESVLAATRTFTVLTFAPGIEISGNKSGYYAFTPDSYNDTFSIAAHTNTTASLQLSISDPVGSILLSLTRMDNLSFTESIYPTLFSANGAYTLRLTATGLSRLFSFISMKIYVNSSAIPHELLDTSLYVNTSVVPLPLNTVSDATYVITLLHSGITEGVYQPGDNLYLGNGTGNYSINVLAINSWSVHTSENATILYETTPPRIYLNISSQSDLLYYRINDTAPIVSLEVSYLGRNLSLSTSTGTLNLQLDQNANFNLTIVARDACGNSASVSESLDIGYFVNVTSSSISAFSLFGLGFVRVLLNGQNVQNATISIKGNTFTQSGISAMSFLMPFGYTRIYANISYDGKTISLQKEVFSISWYPLLALSIAILAFIAARKVSEEHDSDKVEEFILTKGNVSLKELRRVAARSRIRKSMLLAVIQKMESKQLIRTEMDPDGKKFIILLKKGAD